MAPSLKLTVVFAVAALTLMLATQSDANPSLGKHLFFEILKFFYGFVQKLQI